MSTVVFTNPSVARETDTMSGGWIAPSYLLDSTPVPVPMAGAPLPCTITLFPYSGDTLSLETSFDNGVTWEYVVQSTIIKQTSVLISGCSTIRITKVSGSSVLSYFTVC
jgi:hypothetical protein